MTVNEQPEHDAKETTVNQATHDGLPLVRVENVAPQRPGDNPTVRFAEPCPYCRQRHTHGGPVGTEPSHRHAHCPLP